MEYAGPAGEGLTSVAWQLDMPVGDSYQEGDLCRGDPLCFRIRKRFTLCYDRIGMAQAGAEGGRDETSLLQIGVGAPMMVGISLYGREGQGGSTDGDGWMIADPSSAGCAGTSG